MIELKVGMRVKAIKPCSRNGFYEGKIGIITKVDGNIFEHPAYLVSFGEEPGHWGWFLSDALEAQERRSGKKRRTDQRFTRPINFNGERNIYEDTNSIDLRRQYDRRNGPVLNYGDKKTVKQLAEFLTKIKFTESKHYKKEVAERIAKEIDGFLNGVN
jgi:hypothetical protein